tara:strand:+ start:1313 stop:3337 length:2025 start_codon:yes stop_codon:yes gene_type:complete
MIINEFHQHFKSYITSQYDVLNDEYDVGFTDYMCDLLVDQAVIPNYTPINFKRISPGSAGIKIDAYDYNADTGILSLIISDFKDTNDAWSLTKGIIEKNFKLLERFIELGSSKNKTKVISEHSPEKDSIDYISEVYSDALKVNFILISNGCLSSRVNTLAVDGKKHYLIWDLTRLFAFENSGKEKEDINCIFSKPVSALPAYEDPDNAESVKSYLIALPASELVSFYNTFGERLLEQNVRTFLQFRGKVNKGIRNTIQNEPSMFFAYNNGITATAESVKFDSKKNVITEMKNFQIVNGGQTTAALFASSCRDRLDISKIFIQTKLTTLSDAAVERYVPLISRFANTQNKVSDADFFSNHPFHKRIEEFSRSVWAPPQEGKTKDTHWFYERARGQYANSMYFLSPAKQKQFIKSNPKNQMFTKTDLAKYAYTFIGEPNKVSQGAQACFRRFAEVISLLWEKDNTQFNELYYKKIISQALIFRGLDKAIYQQKWYDGHKANIVTYTIARFVKKLNELRISLNYKYIFLKQGVSEELNNFLVNLALNTSNEIRERSDGNVPHFCRKDICWQQIKKIDFDLSTDIPEIMAQDEVDIDERSARKNQGILNGIEAQIYVVNKSGRFWKSLIDWNLIEQAFTEKELSILKIASHIPNKIPSENQSMTLINIENRAIELGFR